MIYLCTDCLPNVDHFTGPEDPRECVCCGKAELCFEVDPKDLVLTLQAAQSSELPSPSLAPVVAPGVPPLVLAVPPALPSLPFPPAGAGK